MAEFPRLKTEFDGIRCELVKAGRGHRYRVDGEIDLMVSVTTHLGIIDKSGGLLGAAQKRIGERIQERLLAVEKGNAPGEDNYQAYLEEVIAWAKANVWGTAAEDGTAAHAMIAAHYGETAPRTWRMTWWRASNWPSRQLRQS